MILRNRRLPPGWYPLGGQEIRDSWTTWLGESFGKAGARAAIAPHAGWNFSGSLAALAVASLAAAETIVVVGGHLPPGYSVVSATEDAYETPLGALVLDRELRDELGKIMPLAPDRTGDNTVEVLLPLVALAQPGAKVVWLRAPADNTALVLGRALAKLGVSLGRNLVVLGSTDLTHYGPDYDFEPQGSGPEAEAWVRETSDAGFIRAALAGDGVAMLAAGMKGAACSSGAAACAASFAWARECTEAKLLGYRTSLELRKAPSFVGYCAISYSPA